MPQTDLPLPELRAYRASLNEPDDLDAFWADTLAAATAQPLDATFEPVVTGLSVIDSWDVTFRGFGGSAVKGWFHTPAGRGGRLPTLVEYIGYGGGGGPGPRGGGWGAGGSWAPGMETRGPG